MKFTRKMVLSAVAVAAFTLGAAHAQNIAVVTHGQANDAFWSVVKNGVEAAAKDSGAKVTYRAPESFDMVAMSRLIECRGQPKARWLGGLFARRFCTRPGDSARSQGWHSGDHHQLRPEVFQKAGRRVARGAV